MTDPAPDASGADDAPAAGDPSSFEDAAPDPDGPVRVVDRRWWARSADAGETDAARSNKPSYVEALEQQLADKDAQLGDYAAKYRAAAAEFEATRARLRREIGKDIEREKRATIAAFLEVADNLERALAAAQAAADEVPAALRLIEGIALVKQQFLTTLRRFGVTPLEAEGRAFDPNHHEAVATVPVDQPAQQDVVMSVVRTGYAIGDDVLRPARVTVGRPAPERS